MAQVASLSFKIKCYKFGRHLIFIIPCFLLATDEFITILEWFADEQKVDLADRQHFWTITVNNCTRKSEQFSQ